ncbi:uncharacterized protein LOC134238272 [Saccostrea cucullata]|uniref:uncharacterized protein LOC134238272 n=1 Tax=Saccostrea cuccullata TaxID=36930 RepID=UPI002ED20C8E
MGRTKQDKTNKQDEQDPKQGKKDEKVEEHEEVSNNDLKALFMKLIGKQENSVNENLKTVGENVDKVEESLSKLKKDFTDIERALEDQDFRISDLETLKTERVDPQEQKITELEARVKQLQDYVAQQENRSRKYNSLLYGIPKSDQENTSETVLECLRHNLKIPEEDIKAIVIQNSHRIPKNPLNIYKPDAPEAIIVKFVRMTDRSLILHQARTATLPKGMAIRSDLANPLKEKRSELAQRAYRMRSQDNLKTRIIETKDDVLLQFRAKGEEEWNIYKL